jgi:type I restriction enzyme S subunit
MENSKPSKQSFKLTEIGWLPKDWEVKKIEEITVISRGASPRPINNYITENGINWIKISDANVEDKLIIKTDIQISEE